MSEKNKTDLKADFQTGSDITQEKFEHLIDSSVNKVDDLSIDANGNVGIGTASPSAKLEVDGNTKVSGELYVNSQSNSVIHYGNRGKLGNATNFNPNNNHNGLWIEASNNGSECGGIFMNGNTMCIWSPGDNDLLRIYDEDSITASSPLVKITSSGTVRAKGFIFEDSVSSHLNYDGAMYRYGGQCYLVHDDNFYLRNRTNGSTYNLGTHFTSSDLKLKKNIRKETNILNRLANLEVKNFQWKRGSNSKKDIGFIAQDVEPLFPDLVDSIIDPDTEETNLTLKYVSFGVLAVGAIKELKDEKDAEITAMHQEIRDLKKNNKEQAELLKQQQQQLLELSRKVEDLLRQ